MTGAADDDPSGIGTYAQAGAQFGMSLLWTLLLTFPLMAAIQEICARIGRVTGRDLASNLRTAAHPLLVWLLLALLAFANVLNIGADLSAMGAAAQLLLPGPAIAYAIAFAMLSLVLEAFVSYRRYSRILMVLTASLLAYVASAAQSGASWKEALIATVVPTFRPSGEYFRMIVAIFGTTISPYLFFWQASQEVEEIRAKPQAKPLIRTGSSHGELRRIRIDTIVGMGASNLVAWFIMLTTAATLHRGGVHEIDSPAKAAAALAPIAGHFASAIFAVGIIGTGLLAVPVLAGSAAYAAGAAFDFRVGLARTPREAPEFYGVIAAAIALGTLFLAAGISPMRALVLAAVVNGVAAVPIMVITMRIATNRKTMGKFTPSPPLATLGWIATGVMTLASLAMLIP